ncbi:WD40-repeat-containing domain protein, partial [Blastocladiella britannica]
MPRRSQSRSPSKRETTTTIASSVRLDPTYLSAGASRLSAGALWHAATGQYVYVSGTQLLAAHGNNNDVNYPLVVDASASLTGHAMTVRAVADVGDGRRIVSAAADGSVRVWDLTRELGGLDSGNIDPRCDAVLTLPPPAGQPVSSATAATLRPTWVCVTAATASETGRSWIVAGETLGRVAVWSVPTAAAGGKWTLVQSWTLPRSATALALSWIPGHSGQQGALVLAIGAADRLVHLRILDPTSLQFEPSLSLSGHDNWPTSLSFSPVSESHVLADPATMAAAGLRTGHVLLASASMDKFIRVWRLSIESLSDSAASGGGSDRAEDVDRALADMMAAVQQDGQLSTKAHVVSLPGSASSNDQRRLHVYLDSVLLGHDDWVHSVAWTPADNATSSAPPTALRLASASADKSVLIWHLERTSDDDDDSTSKTQAAAAAAWTPAARVGEVGGSVLSMHCVVWRPDSRAVAATGYSGAVHIWAEDHDNEDADNSKHRRWQPLPGLSGHTRAVVDATWDPTGRVLFTTSKDQTTRVWARPLLSSPTAPTMQRQRWAEWARPQIHGYDLVALAFADMYTLVSAAEEKIARVFVMPRSFARAMAAAGVAPAGTWADDRIGSVEAANLPALGLSNKAVVAAAGAAEDDQAPRASTAAHGGEYLDRQSYVPPTAAIDVGPHQRPLEEHLLQDTLWPEIDKLYGHGHECVAVAAAPYLGVATSARATAADATAVRVYRPDLAWHEAPPGLIGAHALTVTKIVPYLETLLDGGDAVRPWVVTTGRDRTWAVWCKSEQTENGSDWTLGGVVEKAHARVIWDAAWGPGARWVATASRDKSVKVWTTTMATATKVDIAHAATLSVGSAATAVAVLPLTPQLSLLAIGTEAGAVLVYLGDQATWRPVAEARGARGHTGAVSALAWRRVPGDQHSKVELASVAADGGVRVYNVQV